MLLVEITGRLFWLSVLFFSDTIITSVVPGDYDGDSQMDVLLTAVSSGDKTTTIFIIWGHGQTLGTVQQIESHWNLLSTQSCISLSCLHYSAVLFCCLSSLSQFLVMSVHF